MLFEKNREMGKRMEAGFDAEAVAAHIAASFRRETGHALRDVPPSPNPKVRAINELLAQVHPDRGGVPLVPPPELEARFGKFFVFVSHGESRAPGGFPTYDEVEHLWWVDCTNERTDEESWSVVRQWGPVRLTWSTDSHHLDERWRELVRLMEMAIAG